MAFGSFQLHDSCFNIAHALMAVSYCIPILGLFAEHERTYRAQTQLTMQLEEAKQEAGAANQSKSYFLANMSHEIRTPMTAILGYTDEILEDGEPTQTPEARQQAIEAIRRNGNHLLQIINDILDLSRIEAGRLPIERLRFSPEQLVNEVLSQLRGRAHEKGLEVRLELPSPIPEAIESDPTRTRQILINLLGNAIKFTDQGVIRLVLGEGSTFRVRLPLLPLGGAAPEEGIAPSGQETVLQVPDPNESGEPLHCRILLAEDTHDNQLLSGRILERAGAAVEVVENGRLAVERALAAQEDDEPFHVVLMDMQLPVLDGYDAAQALRKAGYDLPVLALTAHVMAAARQQCLEAGCDDFVTKPINRTRLLEAVGRCLREPKPEATPMESSSSRKHDEGQSHAKAGQRAILARSGAG
ncbi:MAG: response regulator [Deltaproteobacteria bacterium]|nr:response regulator [Deltaproteobacteria bacterium]